MDTSFWPSTMKIDYGDVEVKELCKRFNLSYNSIRDGYCDFKDSGGRQITRKLKPLLNAISTIPCSTSECERGFSCMNIIMSDLRSTLRIDHVSHLMFIAIHGPPVCHWKPESYIISWIAKHRTATDCQTRVAIRSDAEDLKNPDPIWDIL